MMPSDRRAIKGSVFNSPKTGIPIRNNAKRIRPIPTKQIASLLRVIFIVVAI